MPQAASTRGLTTPQPPHSIQPSPLQVRQVSTAGASAAADEADQVDLGGRLGEREVRRAEARRDPVAEHRLREVVERALEVESLTNVERNC